MDDKMLALNQRIIKITGLSPLAKSKLDKEEYRVDTDSDDVDDQTIFDELMMCLFDDMKEIGLLLTCTTQEFCQSRHDLDACLDSLDWVMPATLYVHLKAEPKLHQVVWDLLNGGSESDSILQSYLNYLGGDDNEPGYRSELSQGCYVLRHAVRSTLVFKQYLSSLWTLVESERTQAHGLLNDPVEQISLMTRLVREMDTARTLLSAELTDDDAASFTQVITQSIRELLQPEEMNKKTWLLSTDTSTLGVDERILLNQRMGEWQVGSPLCRAYYITRKMLITPPDLAAILCWSFARCGHSALMLTRMLDQHKLELPGATDQINNWGQILINELSSVHR